MGGSSDSRTDRVYVGSGGRSKATEALTAMVSELEEVGATAGRI
jgi:hypothetical protein